MILIGRLTRDPELRYTQQGTAVARFTLAINRKFKREETDFIDIVVWQKTAENCAQYLTKGQMAMVEGRLQVRSYEAQDGSKQTVDGGIVGFFSLEMSVKVCRKRSCSACGCEASTPAASASRFDA